VTSRSEAKAILALNAKEANGTSELPPLEVQDAQAPEPQMPPDEPEEEDDEDPYHGRDPFIIDPV
jgi:hypothetical protein